MKKSEKPVIGFIGQGWIGSNYADDFENRGYKVIRYDLSPKYKKNKRKLKQASIVFIAVPTPSTPEGFDDSILIEAIKATSKGQIVVIKSTIQVGTTNKMQDLFKDRYIMHSPEFLTEATAKHDVANPARNIVGYTDKSKRFAGRVMITLPVAPYENVVPCKEAEMVKYAGNIWFYIKVVTCNLMYDVCEKYELDYDLIKEMLSADKRVGRTHLEVLHKSGANKKNKIGRGAGGHCFIKDMSAFAEMYMAEEEFCEKVFGEQKTDSHDVLGREVLRLLAEYNNKLLRNSGKDLDLLDGVYGKED